MSTPRSTRVASGDYVVDGRRIHGAQAAIPMLSRSHLNMRPVPVPYKNHAPLDDHPYHIAPAAAAMRRMFETASRSMASLALPREPIRGRSIVLRRLVGHAALKDTKTHFAASPSSVMDRQEARRHQTCRRCRIVCGHEHEDATQDAAVQALADGHQHGFDAYEKEVCV